MIPTLALLIAAPVVLARTPVVGARAIYAMRATLDLGEKGGGPVLRYRRRTGGVGREGTA